MKATYYKKGFTDILDIVQPRDDIELLFKTIQLKFYWI